MNDDTLLQEQPTEQIVTQPTEPVVPQVNTQQESLSEATPVYAENGSLNDTTKMFGTIKTGNEGYVGHNDIYKDVVPFKLNIFGEDVEAKSINSHKIAKEIATAYNGRSEEDYYGYYFAPHSATESWLEAGAKDAINVFADVPYGVASVGAAGVRGVGVYGSVLEKISPAQAEKIKALSPIMPAYLQSMAKLGKAMLGLAVDTAPRFADALTETGKDISDSVKNIVGTDQVLPRSLGAKIAGGVGTSIGSMIGFISAAKYLKMSTGAASVIMNGSVSDEVYRSARDNGYSPMEAYGRSITALGAVSALDKYGFEKWFSMFRGVAKETTGLAIEGAMQRSMKQLAKEAAMTEKQVFWASARRGATNMAGDPVTEVFQNNIQRIFAGDMNKGYTEDMLDEDAITLASTLIVSAFGVPFEIRANREEIRKSKQVVGQYANVLKGMEEARTQFVDKLVASGATKDIAEEIADDLIVNGAEHAQLLVKDANLSLVDGLTAEDIKDFQERLKGMDIQSLATAKFKELDDRVVASLEGVNLKPSDKLLVRACYQGIANWMAYYGVSPDKIPVVPIRTNRLQFPAGKRPDSSTLGMASATRNPDGVSVTPTGLYFSEGNYKNPTGSSPYDSFVEGNVDEAISLMASTILHEMGGHLLDYNMSNVRDLSKFLDAYIGAIKEVFGKNKSDEVKSSLDKYIRGLFKPKGVRYTDSANSTEWFAQAIGRLGHKAAEYIGLKGNPANFVMFANSMLDSASQFDLLSKPLQDYLNQYKKLVKENSDIIKAMAEERGITKLNSLFQRMQDNPDLAYEQTLITPQEIVDLYDIAKSYLDSDAAQIVTDIYEGVDFGGFEKIIDDLRMFNTALDNPDATEEQLTNNAFNTVLNDDGTISESAVDVESTFEMIQKEDAETERTGKSSLARQLDRKIDGISLKEDFKTIQEAVAEKIKQGPLGKLYRALLGSATSYGMSEFIRAIGGEKLEKRFGLLAKHEAYDDAVIAKHDRLTGRIQTEVLGIKPKDAGSSVALQKLDNELSVKNVEVEMIDPRDATRTPRKVKLSQFELMDMYNIYKQTEAYVDEYGNVVGLSPRERLQKMFPTMKVEDILQNLDPRAKKYADIMAEEIGKELPTFVKAIEEMGMNPNFKPVKNYWPITTAVYQAEGEDYTNVTVARKGTEAEVGVFDAREKFNRYMSRVAATESQFYPALRRLRDLLYFKPNMVGTYHSPTEEARARRYQEESRNLQYLVQQRLGDKAFNQFVNLLDDFLKTRSENILSDSLAAKAGRNLTAALLMFKPIQAVKNFSNFFSHCGLAKDQGKYWNNTLRGIMNPKQTWETMMKYSTLCRKRLRGMSYSEYLNQQTTGGDSLVGTLFKNYSERNAKWTKEIAPGVANFLALNNVIKKLGMSPMLLGDAGSNVFGGYGLFMELVEKNNGDMEAAGKEFDETILRRQSSSNQATKSLLQRQWGRDFKGTFIAFTSEALNKTRDFVRSIEMVKEGEMTVKEAVMSNTSLLASVVAYSLISAGIWDLMSDDEEEREQVKQGLLDELLSQAGGTTIFGSAFVVPMIRMLFGEYSTGVSNAPLSEFAKFVKNVHNVAVGKDEDFANAFLQGLTIAGIGVGAPNALNSLRGVGRYATGSTEKERGAGLRQAFGRSKSYAEKREGIKPTKKTVEKDDEEE